MRKILLFVFLTRFSFGTEINTNPLFDTFLDTSLVHIHPSSLDSFFSNNIKFVKKISTNVSMSYSAQLKDTTQIKEIRIEFIPDKDSSKSWRFFYFMSRISCKYDKSVLDISRILGKPTNKTSDECFWTFAEGFYFALNCKEKDCILEIALSGDYD